MLDVSHIWVRSFDLSYLDIYWEVGASFEDIADYQFIVEAAEEEFGPFYAISAPLVDQFHFRDTTVRGQHSQHHNRWYRIRTQYRIVAKQTADGASTDVVAPNTGGGVRLAARPDLIALEMARANRLMLKEHKGRQLWIYPKKRSGQRCPSCFDKVTQRMLRGDCPTCFSTGWAGGFHSPVSTYGMLVTPDESTTTTSFGVVETANTTLFLGNYPDISSGDIIIEAENVRWRVGDRITKVSKGRAVVRQQFPVHEIPKGDVEYSIPLNLTADQIKDLEASPTRNFTNPQTLTGVSLQDALTAIFPRKL